MEIKKKLNNTSHRAVKVCKLKNKIKKGGGGGGGGIHISLVLYDYLFL